MSTFGHFVTARGERDEHHARNHKRDANKELALELLIEHQEEYNGREHAVGGQEGCHKSLIETSLLGIHKGQHEARLEADIESCSQEQAAHVSPIDLTTHAPFFGIFLKLRREVKKVVVC